MATFRNERVVEALKGSLVIVFKADIVKKKTVAACRLIFCRVSLFFIQDERGSLLFVGAAMAVAPNS